MPVQPWPPMPAPVPRPERPRRALPRRGRSPDDLVRAKQDRLRHVDPERARALEVHPRLDLVGLLDGQVARARAFAEAVDELRGTPEAFGNVRPVGNEA